MKKSYLISILLLSNLIFSQAGVQSANKKILFTQVPKTITNLDVVEITGTTGSSGGVTDYENKLPKGWNGANARILSLEIQYSSGHWYSIGFENTLGRISARLYDTSREVSVYFPNQNQFHNRPWRALIAKVL